jgi:hypothetical protein
MLAQLFNFSFASAHVKATYNGEFRRFLLKPVTYATLETNVRSLFNLNGCVLSLKFEDDEKDWVSITTDQELCHAIDLAGSPLRVFVQVVSTPQQIFVPEISSNLSGVPEYTGIKGAEISPVVAPVPEVAAAAVAPEIFSVSVQSPQPFVPEIIPSAPAAEIYPPVYVPAAGEEFAQVEAAPVERDRKQGKACLGKAERLEMKQTRISAKIVFLEQELNSQKLSEDRAEGIKQQLSHLRERLDFVKNSLENQDPHNMEENQKPSTCEGWGGRRGGRGGGRGGRGRKNDRINERIPPEILENFHQKKIAFQKAKENGNPEEIQACKAAWMQAKQAKWVAIDELRDELGEEETTGRRGRKVRK